MNRHIKSFGPRVSRRQFMIGAAGLSFAIALDGTNVATVLAKQRTGEALSPWISIGTDGTITIMSAAVEMGQGTMTSLPLIIAEELDADWSKVKIMPAPVIEAIYGNPGFFLTRMYTSSQNAVSSYYQPLRLVGAQVRRVLLDNAANRLGVPVAELTTEPSMVVHATSGRRLSYGEIASFAEIPAQAPTIGPDELKKPSDFRLIGKDVMRVELPSKVNGSAIYSIDVQVPGMLYGILFDRRAGSRHALRNCRSCAGRRVGAGRSRRQQRSRHPRRDASRQVAVRRGCTGRDRVGSAGGSPGP